MGAANDSDSRESAIRQIREAVDTLGGTLEERRTFGPFSETAPGRFEGAINVVCTIKYPHLTRMAEG